MTHRLTIYLEGNSSITTDTSEPVFTERQLSDAIHSYYKRRWWRRTKTVLLINNPNPRTTTDCCSSSFVAAPVEKVVAWKMEQLT